MSAGALLYIQWYLYLLFSPIATALSVALPFALASLSPVLWQREESMLEEAEVMEGVCFW